MSLGADRFESIPHAFFDRVATTPDHLVYSQAIASQGEDSAPRARRAATFAQVGGRVRKLAAYLRAAGAAKGTRIAIVSQTRPEWMEADLAILAAGGTSVSVYQSLPAHDVGYILFDSGSSIVFAENQEQVDKLIELATQQLFEVAATEDRPALKTTIPLRRIISFEKVTPHELVISLEDAIQQSADVAPDLSTIAQSDLAALVYTSGTTGPPKGVIQTHKNHLANVRQAFESGLVTEGATLMLFLPLAHSFAKLMGYVGFLSSVTLRFPAVVDTATSKLDPTSITRDIREANAHIIPLVPRFLEKMREGILLKAHHRSTSARMLRAALWAALKIHRAKSAGRNPSSLALAVFRGTGFIRNKIRQQLFGSEFRFAISGSAKLNVAVAEFFDALGLEVLEGYGLTETCVATNVNRLGRKKIGTVGPVLAPDIELRIADDGEILFRGPNVTQGYYNRIVATAETWDQEGWLHTGDLGSLDSEGYLTITGRKKELLKTSGGKYIVPTMLEEKLLTLPLVSQAIVVGEGRPYCVAVLALKQDALKLWATQQKVTFDSDWTNNSQLRAAVTDQLQLINSSLASYETVKNFVLAREEFTVENGLLTPTYKAKRKLVEQLYKREIDELYARPRSA